MSYYDRGTPFADNTVVASSSLITALYDPGDAHAHLGKVVISVASVTDGAWVDICASATSNILFTVSASTNAAGYIDFGDPGYPMPAAGDVIYAHMHGALAKAIVNVMGYIR